MSHRRFADRQGRRWEVRVRSRSEWRFEPLSGNPAPPRRGQPPLYATDPFELSEEELRRILTDARERSGPRPRSPFGDDPPSGDPSGGGPRRPSPFGDDPEPPAPKSPFLDDR